MATKHTMPRDISLTFSTRKENEHYVGPLPPKKDYMPEAMSVEDLIKFETWYDEQVQNDAIFDFQRDIVAYCCMDVTILREGCQTFQRLFQKETAVGGSSGFNPFEHITRASNRDLNQPMGGQVKLETRARRLCNGSSGLNIVKETTTPKPSKNQTMP